MKHTQLVFDFGKSVLRHLRLLPDVEPTGHTRKPHLRRDPILEDLCLGLLKAAGCKRLKVSVSWNSRLRTTAGLACWTRKAIYLNPRLIEISPQEVQRTLRHELAHFVAHYRAGRRRIEPHGEEWREACADLGIPNEQRCHDLPLPRSRMTRKYFYACRQCQTVLSRVRPVKRRVACIRCCRKHNNGKYDERFRFIQIQQPDRAAA